MDYFVTPSIATDDAAVWEDRETGSLDLVAKLTRDDDGAPDASHPVTLTIDLDVTDDHHVIVRQNGTVLHPVPTREQVLDAITCGNQSVCDFEAEIADRVLTLLQKGASS